MVNKLIRQNNSNKGLTFIYFLILALLLTNTNYATNYFRVRTDTLALLILVINLYFIKKEKYSLLFVLLYPILGIKHLLYSFLSLSLNNNLTLYLKKILNLGFEKLILITITALCLLVWSFVLFFNEFIFWINNFYNQDNSSYIYMTKWIKIEWPYLLFSIIFILLLSIKQKSNYWIALGLLTGSLLLSSFHMPYFINLYIFPVYLLGLFSFIEITILPRHKYISVVILFLFISFSNYFNLDVNKYFSTNQLQFETLSTLETFVSKHSFSYVDGTGLLPKPKQLSCYISPSDFISNENCVRIILTEKPDIILRTQRLSLIFSESFLKHLSKDYNINSNFLIKKDLAIDSSELMWPDWLIYHISKFEQ